MTPMMMSAIGGRPAAAIVKPLGTSVAALAVVIERTALSTGVMLCVVAVQVTTISLRGMPCETSTSRNYELGREVSVANAAPGKVKRSSSSGMQSHSSTARPLSGSTAPARWGVMPRGS